MDKVHLGFENVTWQVNDRLYPEKGTALEVLQQLR